MRILMVHNSYRHFGGEDAVVAREAALLAGGGHDVHIETVTNHSIYGMAERVRVFLNAPYDSERKKWMQSLLARYCPDLVHIHNFFPLLTPAIHEAAAEAGLAVVQTLHNYRLICLGGLLMRNGSTCEKCIGGASFWGIFHRCYRSSMLGSLAIARMQWRTKRQATWRHHVHRFIALTQFAREKFIEGGLPASRIVVKPNFVSDSALQSDANREGALFVGRLSAEKGVHVLIQAWKRLSHIPLTIVGDGPEYESLKAQALPNVSFLGQRRPEEVHMLMARAQMLVMPSICYETFGITIVEAFAMRLPVMASGHGAMRELIEDGKTGYLFAPGDIADLAAIAACAFANPARLERMGGKARAAYERLYTPGRNLRTLETIYEEAIDEARTAL